MNRLDFLGLNSNQAACVLLYLMAVLWVLHFCARRAWIKIVLMVIEAVLIVAMAATMSRGGVVVLVCVAVYMRWIVRNPKSQINPKSRNPKSQINSKFQIPNSKANRTQLALRWLSYSPIWRVLLLLSSPGLWSRSAPAYVAQDASIGNRLELWKGGAKLIAGAPLHGWGYYNTGASYMNWFQDVDVRTHYNGLVNSFLQIGAAFGLPVLFGVLFVLMLALLSAHCLNLASLRDAVFFNDKYRWCRSPSLAQPPANVCQASGLKSSSQSQTSESAAGLMSHPTHPSGCAIVFSKTTARRFRRW